jgi:hypothetical protein
MTKWSVALTSFAVLSLSLALGLPADPLQAGSFPPASGSSTTQPCAFMWATRPLPILASGLQTALDGAGIAGSKVIANAFGETCGNQFMAMQSEITIDAPVAASLDDLAALGDTSQAVAGAVLPVLSTAGRDVMPGPNTPKVTVIFKAADGHSRVLVSSRTLLNDAQSGQLAGEAFLRAAGTLSSIT